MDSEKCYICGADVPEGRMVCPICEAGAGNISSSEMTINAYQKLAGRTINVALTREQCLRHALFEMCGELGEIHSIYQKVYQGHKIKVEDLKHEVGDLLWGIAEFCTVNGWDMEDVCRMNIEKLKARYPDGFSAERSVNRAE